MRAMPKSPDGETPCAGFGRRSKPQSQRAYEGYRDGAKVDPEKIFVATIANAHMLSALGA